MPAAEVVGSVQEKKCMYFDSHHLIAQLANCLLQLQECLDSPALGTSCRAPFARHLLPGTSCRESLTRHLLPALQLSHVASTFFSDQTVAAVEVNDRA